MCGQGSNVGCREEVMLCIYVTSPLWDKFLLKNMKWYFGNMEDLMYLPGEQFFPYSQDDEAHWPFCRYSWPFANWKQAWTSYFIFKWFSESKENTVPTNMLTWNRMFPFIFHVKSFDSWNEVNWLWQFFCLAFNTCCSFTEKLKVQLSILYYVEIV